MKKIILSLILVFGFAGYALNYRIINTDAPIVLTPEPDKPQVALTLPTYTPSAEPITPTPATPKPTPKPTPVPTPTPTPTPIPVTPPVVVNGGKFKNGTYTGDSIDAYYGYVQVKVVISGGKITDVQFLDYPQDRQTSQKINNRAMPYLISEAIKAQDSNVNTVSGASFTSKAFRKSLASALIKAKV
ncbi:MAG: FMN-binding protein [Candidatus Pacebacteria bacterium]|nr:FMN-binding protein [Candidatus Paceibacterota bacterium]